MLEKNGVLMARRARGTAEFRGTVRYVAPAVHDRKEQGRRDDIWSLLYMLIELHCGLPWQYDRDKKLIEAKKLSVPDKVLLNNFPGKHFYLYCTVETSYPPYESLPPFQESCIR